MTPLETKETQALILIVDDEPKNLQVLGTILMEQNYQVVAANSGESTLNVIEQTVPDLILLDVMMPHMDGYETCIRIKENESLKETPVIFLTAKVEPEDIVRGFDAGGVDYVSKPFNHTELLARISTHIALKKSKEKYRIVADFTYDWEYWTDINGNFIYVSPACERTTGYTPEEFYANKNLIENIIYPDDKKLFLEHKNKIIKNRGSKPLEYRIIAKNKKIQWIRHVCRDVFSENRTFLGIRGSNRLITEQKKAEQALKESEQKLRESNITKDKFFSIIAHDLKSPFNAMLGFSNLLLEKFDTYDVQEQKIHLGMINKSIQNTYKLLENLLLWSQIQRGTINFDTGKENLHQMSCETIDLLVQSAKDKEISLINQIKDDIYVRADKNMLSTITRNLISNAIKFTPQGGTVEINCSPIINKNNEPLIEIQVKDNGIGINNKTKENLFNISTNISTKGTENETGTGLGLILCKEFIEKQNGKIRVESEVGKGSKFIFTLPACKLY